MAGSGLILAKPIIPTAISSRQFNVRILNALKDIEKDIKSDYRATVATWNHKPKFESEIRYRGGSAIVEVFTFDKIYGYIDLGTNVRYAVMTQDFSPKSRRNVIGSFGGSGGVAFISKNPQAGIRARHFSFNIQKNNEDRFAKLILEAVDKAMATPAGAFR